jgi:putative ABC transport system substrate-binding protein
LVKVGRSERFAGIAAEFVRLNVDVILTHNTPPSLAAKQATSVIPIVFATTGDPVGSGIVASLARPGGNVTGLSVEAPDTASKKLGLLRELVPDLHRLAILADVGNPYAMLDERKIGGAARTVGVEVSRRYRSRFRRDEGPRAGAICHPRSAPVRQSRSHQHLGARRTITLHGVREYVEVGGLMSYGPNWLMWRRAGDLVDKILRGAKPADIPVEQPTKFDLVINLTTAKALGLTIPQSLVDTPYPRFSDCRRTTTAAKPATSDVSRGLALSFLLTSEDNEPF